MKKVYGEPSVEIIEFSVEDVLNGASDPTVTPPVDPNETPEW